MSVLNRGATEWLVAVALVTLVVGCTTGGTSNGSTASPMQPSGSEDIRYDWFDGELCDRIRWDDIGSRLDLELEVTPRGFDGPGVTEPPWDSPETYPWWYAECRIDSSASEGMPIRRANGYIVAAGYRDPQDAQERYHHSLQEPPPGATHRSVERLDGWWDNAGYEEHTVFQPQGSSSFSLAYHVQHINLYIWIQLHPAMSSHVWDRGIELVHEFSRELIEETRIQVPVGTA